MNNRGQDLRLTRLKQLKVLFHASKRTFPNADLYYPILNYRIHLS